MHVVSASNQKPDRGYACTLRSISVGLLCGANLLLLSLPLAAQVSAPATKPQSTSDRLPPVGKCLIVVPSVSGRFASSYIRNVCEHVTVDVKFCYHTLKRPFEAFDAYSCELAHFGSTGPIAPGQRKAITFVPASLLTFPCPYPNGTLDLGAGVGVLVPVTTKTPYACRAR